MLLKFFLTRDVFNAPHPPNNPKNDKIKFIFQ